VSPEQLFGLLTHARRQTAAFKTIPSFAIATGKYTVRYKPRFIWYRVNRQVSRETT